MRPPATMLLLHVLHRAVMLHSLPAASASAAAASAAAAAFGGVLRSPPARDDWPVALRSCNSGNHSGGFQSWSIRPNAANTTEVSLHLVSDPTACIKAVGSAVWVEACSTNVSSHWILQPTGESGAFLLVHAATGHCAAAGCNAQLTLEACEGRGKCLDTSTSSPAGNSTSHPQDCFLTHSNVTGQLRTVSSQLCVDGGSNLPSKGCTDEQSKSLPFCNVGLSNHARARDLVSRLSVQEMASGVLSMLNVPPRPQGTATPMQLGRMTAGVARLGAPPILYNEALHGPVAQCLPPSKGGRCPTMWPIHILQSASFNHTLWHTIATQIGTEGRALHNSNLNAANFWGPDVNGFRDPRYGRGQETPGEDAWVNAMVAEQYILGLQDGPANGTHSSQRLRATAACKHIIVYDGQSGVSINVSIRDLNDYYMQPWHGCAAVPVASMMCSYGALNVSSRSGLPSTMVPDCADGNLINGVIRKRWNWTGFVVSDW